MNKIQEMLNEKLEQIRERITKWIEFQKMKRLSDAEKSKEAIKNAGVDSAKSVEIIRHIRKPKTQKETLDEAVEDLPPDKVAEIMKILPQKQTAQVLTQDERVTEKVMDINGSSEILSSAVSSISDLEERAQVIYQTAEGYQDHTLMEQIKAIKEQHRLVTLAINNTEMKGKDKTAGYQSIENAYNEYKETDWNKVMQLLEDSIGKKIAYGYRVRGFIFKSTLGGYMEISENSEGIPDKVKVEFDKAKEQKMAEPQKEKKKSPWKGKDEFKDEDKDRMRMMMREVVQEQQKNQTEKEAELEKLKKKNGREFVD